MGMRLLPKSELDKAKASEKQREVQEGLKLARRVDNLREVAASEEESLGKFRRETVGQIHNEISKELEKRDSLIHEVAGLEEKRKKAIEPLDKERASLIVVQEYTKRFIAEANERDSRSRERESSAQNDRHEAAILVERARTNNELSIAGLQESERTKKDAKILLIAARKVDAATTDRKNRVEQELIHREVTVANREVAVTMVETDLSAREKVLADGWKLLRDREALLERTIKRTQ